MDLRENRRIETADQIRHAAFEIVRDHGDHALTIDAICRRAGVSARTFFNYFPYKEAALVVSPPPFAEEAIAAFRSSDGDLLTDLISLFASQAEQISGERWLISLIPTVAQSFPKVMPLQAALFHALDTQIAGLIARRCARPEGDLGCRILASACTAANKAAIDAWLEAEDRPLSIWVREGLGAALSISTSRTDRH